MASSLLLRRGTKNVAQKILKSNTTERSVCSIAVSVSHAPPTSTSTKNEGFGIRNHQWKDAAMTTTMRMSVSHPCVSTQRSFSDAKPLPADAVTSPEEVVAEAVQTIEKNYNEPSPLETLAPDFTPGQALFLLRTKGAGGQAIRRSEFHNLCMASRPGWKTDAVVIHTALLEFKRCNSFLVEEYGAKLAMEAMMKSMLPSGHPSKGEAFGERRLNAALFVAEAFANEKTGLCFAASTDCVDTMLQDLYQGVQECELKISPGEEENESGIANRVLNAVETTIFYLNRRAGPSEKKMKKRAARKYLKQLVSKEGPSVATAHVGAQICTYVDGLDCAKARVLTPYKRRGYKISDETAELVNRVKEEEKVAAEAAAAAVEQEEDAESEEGEEEEEDASENQTEK
mmetsp:Transcript_12974/g.19395  ORF Transcript_12974/g.19395 Transcript_12974/m.19395 type:complete len:400 (-) Transcript_12974:54-1253(-)